MTRSEQVIALCRLFQSEFFCPRGIDPLDMLAQVRARPEMADELFSKLKEAIDSGRYVRLPRYPAGDWLGEMPSSPDGAPAVATAPLADDSVEPIFPEDP